MPQPLPAGIQNGTYTIRPTDAGTLEIDVREFVGWWDTEQSNFVRQIKEAKPEVIRLSIASEGGFVSDALAIHDFLKAYPARVEVDITGLTASAATVIAMAGDSVRMSDNALFLVHHASGGAWGKAEDLESYTRGLRKINGRLLSIYAKKTRQTEAEIDALMAAEEWLTADEALEWGFVDSVYEPAPDATATAATAGFRAVAHAPAPDVLKALSLPPLPTANHQPRVRPSATMPQPQNPATPPATPTQEEPQNRPEPAPQPQPESRPQPTPPQANPNDRSADDVAQMRAELDRIKAENARLAKERRTAAVNALRTALTGRVPGVAVDALCEMAEVLDERTGGEPVAWQKPTASAPNGQQAGVIARLSEIAATITPMVERGALPTSDLDAEAAQKVAKAYAKF